MKHRPFIMSAEEFADRTGKLAVAMGCSISDLTTVFGVCGTTLSAYRTGRYAASRWVIRSLEDAERSAGIVVPRKYTQTLADKAPASKAPAEAWLLQGLNSSPDHYRLESNAGFLALALALADKSKHPHHLGLTSLDTLIELHAILEQAGATHVLRRVKEIRIHNP